MTNCYEYKKPCKVKKDIKWYTYVDSFLDSKLHDFMEEYKINNQAETIRNCVNYCIDYLNVIFQKKSHKGPQKYDEIELDNLIKKAINEYEIGNGFHEELKQKLSPLKLSLLMLNNYIEDKEKLLEGIQNAISSLEDIELSVKRHFEEPKLIRFIKKFDILYIEDNELERKTINTYFKRKGVDIKSVETSEEGLDILKVSTPQAFLLDIDLRNSNIDGAKLCQMLKSKELYKTIPIILISAVVSEKKRKEILKTTDADDLIIKPIDKLADLDVLLKYLK
jgi:CheY-like chemotaxis protein